MSRIPGQREVFKAPNGQVDIIKPKKAIVPTSFVHDDEEAKGRLIAAAPEMLEALELMMAAITNSHQRSDAQVAYDIVKATGKAKTAIAKATGQQ